MKYVKLYRIVKIPLANLKQKMKAEGRFEPVLIDLFVDTRKSGPARRVVIVVVCRLPQDARLIVIDLQLASDRPDDEDHVDDVRISCLEQSLHLHQDHLLLRKDGCRHGLAPASEFRGRA